MTRSAISCLLKPLRRSENATSSATVGITIWLSGSVKTKPTRRRTSRPLAVVSSPSRVTEPLVGLTSPLIIRARVDLPDPLAPTMPIRRSVSSQVDAVQHDPVAESVMHCGETDLGH